MKNNTGSDKNRQFHNDDQKAVEAAGNASVKEAFLSENSEHILRLAAKLSGHLITKSDDEWSVALIAAAEAIDKYDPEKGDFWGFASVVIKSRLLNLYQSNKRTEGEIAVSPEAFEGEVEEDDPELSFKLKLQDKMAVSDNVSGESALKDEILALEEELQAYHISFFDLTESSPKSAKTKKGCMEVIASFFLPPPLMEYLKKKGALPAKELKERSGQTVKFLDKFRKYLIASVLIIDGDYPGLADYIPYKKSAQRK